MDYRDPKASKGQVERLARLYFKRFSTVFGASLEVEDLEQQFWLVWVDAVRLFDETKGVRFSTYLGTAIAHKVNDMARRHQRRAHVGAMSLNVAVDGVEILEMIEGDTDPGDLVLERKQERARIESKIDPRLLKMVRIMEDVPVELSSQLPSLEAKAAFAASLGVPMRAPKEINLQILSDLFGISRSVRYRMLEDLEKTLDG